MADTISGLVRGVGTRPRGVDRVFSDYFALYVDCLKSWEQLIATRVARGVRTRDEPDSTLR